MLLARLREQMNSRSTLHVLCHGIEIIGLKLPPARFIPALAMNPEISGPVCRQTAARGSAGLFYPKPEAHRAGCRMQLTNPEHTPTGVLAFGEFLRIAKLILTME